MQVYAQNTSAQPGFKLVFEKTYLHTDRDIYAPGDTLWFKAYLVNAQDNKLSNSSNNLYVDLISPDAKVLRSILIRLDNGTGIGDIDLPDTLATGAYRLRAYTNWMRNFGDNFIFEKTLTVIGDKTATNVPVIAAKNKKTLSFNAGTPITPPPAVVTAASVDFFPEGGSLMEGINSIVAVKAGDAKPVAGAVISSAGDTVAHFNCDSLGMGLFALLPLKGQYYRAVVKGIAYPLPLALSSGMALQVRPTDSLLRVVISRSDTSYKSAMLTVKHAGITVLSQQVVLSAEQVAAKIPVAGLPEGICAITLYDETGKPNCERLVYIHHPQANANLMVKTDKATYNPKEKVNVVITAEPNTSLSLTVADAAMVDAQADNITSNLMLSSELRGNIEHPARYFDITNINRFKQLDLLLMTQGWRDFVWRRLADTAIRISYAGENNVVVSGKIEDEVTHKPMPGLFVTLRADANKGDKLFDAVTDAAGHFAVTGLNLYGKQKVSLTSTSPADRIGTFIMDSLSRPAIKLIVNATALKEDSIAEAAMQKKTVEIRKANLKGVTRLKEVKIKAKGSGIYLRSGGVMQPWGTDQIFNITAKDNEYKTLEWYLLQNSKGAIKPVYDPNRLLGPTDQLLRPLTGLAYIGVDTFRKGAGYISKTKPIPPLLIVNGVELNMDYDYSQAEVYRDLYFNMPINKFKKIVLKRVAGTLHGIQPPELVDITGHTFMHPQAEMIVVDRYLLYLTLIDNYLLDNPGLKTVDIDGYYQVRTFYQPPPNAKSQLADYRSTIHWEPNIKTDANGKATVGFYNNAAAASFRVIVQGISTAGTPLVGVMSYKVK